MFQTARLKLTAWYLLIIMMVSLSFSAVIYRTLTSEVERFSRMQRSRIENRLKNTIVIPFDDGVPPPFLSVDDTELVDYIKHRIIITLMFVNSSIFILAGLLGYMLAGRTLKPIAEMVDEQNRFISDASHELRTPLTALKSTLEVNLRDKNLTLNTAKTILKESIDDVNTLQSLSDSLLTLAQYQRQNGHTKFESVDVTNLLSDAIKQVTPLAKLKHISIHLQANKAKIRGVRYSLLDLFVILLDNAVKYTKHNGEIRICVAYKNNRTIISVQDTGIGIAPNDIPHIFDRFYRADAARTKKSKDGYGLGLSIAKKIVETHHGDIDVVSTRGAGSTFTVTFS